MANKATKQSGTGGVTKQQQSKIKKSNLIATDILHIEDQTTAEVLRHADDNNKTSTTNSKENEDDDEEDVQENVSWNF